jgi:Pyruvate/2-oxoacid:ferredoxin oxidoreductase delta subunit
MKHSGRNRKCFKRQSLFRASRPTWQTNFFKKCVQDGCWKFCQNSLRLNNRKSLVSLWHVICKGDGILRKIIAADESWAHQNIPESKTHDLAWRYPSSVGLSNSNVTHQPRR